MKKKDIIKYLEEMANEMDGQAQEYAVDFGAYKDAAFIAECADFLRHDVIIAIKEDL